MAVVTVPVFAAEAAVFLREVLSVLADDLWCHSTLFSTYRLQ